MIIDSLNNIQKFTRGKIYGNHEIFNIINGKLSHNDKIHFN